MLSLDGLRAVALRLLWPGAKLLVDLGLDILDHPHQRLAVGRVHDL